MKIFTAEQLYKADAITTTAQGISSTDLMERAGDQVFNWLHHRMKGAQVPIHIFCGIGNNGGDGLVVGRSLIKSGYNVFVYIVNCSDKRSKDFLLNYDRIKNVTKEWPQLLNSENDFPQINVDDIIIDAIFGIGLNRCPVGWVKSLIQFLNNTKAFILSIDIPSGLFANMPLKDPDAVIKANHTLTFQVPKLAFFLPETGIFVPFYEILDIGLDAEYLELTEPAAFLIGKAEARFFYKQREKFDHKGNFGHSLIIAGSHGKMGAAILSAKATLRTGAGLVTVYSPKCGYSILQSTVPEAMVLSDPNSEYISEISYSLNPSAIGVGMGIGTNPITIKALRKIIETAKAPLVIDADAINGIAEDKELLAILPKHSILTPHLGELRRLIGDWKNDYEKIEIAKKFAKKHGLILVIKGANTLIISEEKMYINSSGNPGMATAGSGDVLSGVITGLLSQGYSPLEAAIFGVYLHGSSGDIAFQRFGFEAIIASDIIDNLGNAYLELFEEEQPVQQEEK